MVSKASRKAALSHAIPASDRRERFVAEYLIDANGTRAAIAAGYAPKAAHVTASRLLRDAKIAAQIAGAQERVHRALAERYDVTAEKITRELAKIGFSSLLDYGQVNAVGDFEVDLRNTPEEAFAAVQTVKTKRAVRYVGETEVHETQTELKLLPKREALVDLGKIHGLFKDGVDVTVPVRFIVERTARSKQGEAA